MNYLLENLKDNGIGLNKILSFFLIVFLVVGGGIYLFIANRPKGYLIVNEKLILTKRMNNWETVKKISNDILDKKYHVVNYAGEYDGVTISYRADSNSWYYMDKDYSDLNLKMVRAAYTDDFKGIKVANYSVSYYDESDDEILNGILPNIVRKNGWSVIKSEFDLDGNGVKEIIYTVNNATLTDGNGKIKSYIFLVRNGSVVKMLDDDTSKPYLVRNIIDIDKDGKYEVIVSKGDIDVSTFDSCYQIYKIKGNNIKRILDC